MHHNEPLSYIAVSWGYWTDLSERQQMAVGRMAQNESNNPWLTGP